MPPFLGVLAALLILAAAPAEAGVLDRVAETKTLRLGYRTDAPPFSAEPTPGMREGYALDLCRAVADAARHELGLPAIVIQYIAVTAENRFDQIESGPIGLLCGPTTATLSRRQRVDFSLPTFVAGAGVMVTSSAGITRLDDLAGRRLGVRAGTTTEQALRSTYPQADIHPTADHRDGIASLLDGRLDAYFADRAVLEGLKKGLADTDADALQIADDYLTIEPYGLALPRGDSRFRLLVDRTISSLYQTRQIEVIARRHFDGEISELLHTLYQITPLPE